MSTASNRWRALTEYIGHDDDGNQVYRVVLWNPYDPDDCEIFLLTEFIY